jgi:hypothetical protein
MEPTHIQRLALIKYLFSIGQTQSHQPEPLYGISILSFHDSVELFLQLCLEKLKISKKSQSFMDYWDIINEMLENKTLSQKESMKRLNQARVGLKHSGIIPSKLDIESFRAVTLAFFNENCPIIFQIEFDDISLVDIIKFERSREFLKQAKKDFDKGLIYESIQSLILSFVYLLRDYEESKIDRIRRSPFFFGESVTSFDSFHLGFNSNDGKFKDFVDKVTKSIDAIQTAIKILSFDIDYKKYVKYKSIVSSVQLSISDGGQVHSYMHGEMKLTKEDLDFCTNFIVESALKLQEFDFELEKQ